MTIMSKLPWRTGRGRAAASPIVETAIPAADRVEIDRARARALAADGRHREAFAIGQAANLVARDAQFERDLRNWRNLAFYETAPGPGRADWPVMVDDPWPDHVDRIPEVECRDLTPRLLAGALAHHGSLIVRNLLTAQKAAHYVATMDRAFTGRESGVTDDAWDPLMPRGDHDLSVERAFGGTTTVLMVDAPEFLSMWLDELRGCGVLDVVADHLGERPAISANKANLYRLPPNPGSQWHQDGAFLGRDIRTVNLWVAGTECGVDAPGLDIIPWRVSEIVRTGSDDSIFGWSVGEGLAAQVAGDRPIASPHFNAGDGILFDQLCLHRTGIGPNMTKGRYAIETWMFAPSHYSDGVPLTI